VTDIDPGLIEPTVQPPTIVGYYANSKLRPASFFKAVRAAKIKAFHQNDVEAAHATLSEKDPNLSRTLALGLANKPPEPVQRWVMEVARSVARRLNPEITLEESTTAETVFVQIVRAVEDALRSKKKADRDRAQNLVRLSMLWLIRQRALDPLQALYGLLPVSRKSSGRSTPRAEAQSLVLRAKPSQWKMLSVVANLSSDDIKEANRARNEAFQVRDMLRTRVADLERSLESKSQEIDGLANEARQLEAEVASGKSALEAQRQLRQLDAAEATGRTRNLLAGRLSLLLSDAADALEFEPPHIEAARQRINAARETIAGEVGNSND
jgi:hypothetical protein